MNRLTKILTSSIGALMLTAFAGCDYIHDDSLPRCEYRLHFVYDYNMKFADAFQQEVNKAALFICDAQGKFITRRDIEGSELKANSVIMDLEPGRYQVLTWAGLASDSYSWPDLTPGSSTLQEIQVKTLREADGSQPNELTPLWHSLDELQVVGDTHEDKTISLAKNTNKLRLVLQDTDGNCMDVRDFTFEIRADNGFMDYDNSLLADTEISYQPYFTQNVNIAEGDSLMGKPLMQTVAVAELNTMRLMDKKNYRLIVRHNDWEKDVINVNLCNYLLLTQMEGHDISAQEYLDRQDEYSIVFFLTPTYCPDCPPVKPDEPDEPVEPEDPDNPDNPDEPENPDTPDNPNPDEPDIPEPEVPIVAYSCFKVQVKDWVIRINNGEL
ncbi:MAG: FimB/Mfa2 family fimbrial subunit [Parabacteroides sp.]